MSDTVIRVENLSKKYVISHRGERGSYSTFRESIASGVKSLARRFSSGAPTGPSQEEFWALKDVSFEVKRGEVVGIIGRNGAGKSTLLKVLSRITEPTSGRITIDGRVASLLEVGTGFHPELTGRENVFLNGSILGMTRQEVGRKFDEIVQFAEIERFLDTPVKRYSSGMYMRLAFAVAAHLEPEILIVDEVLAVGDSAFQKKCLGKIGDVTRNSGRTVLLVSHNMQAVRQIASCGVMLSQGRIISAGDIRECVSAYEASGKTSGEEAGWKRTSGEYGKILRINEVKCELAGSQPNHILNIEILMASVSRHRNCTIAADIIDEGDITVGQSVPSMDGFISGEPGPKKALMKIELPPLIPGNYSVQLWLGNFGIETLDQVRHCASFVISESPTKNRTQYHDKKYGFVVPMSTVTIELG